MDELNWPLMLGAGIVASASPGPATLGIAGISMRYGRLSGLVLAAGIVTGSYFWSITAALGFGAILMAHVWILETVRYCGAAYSFISGMPVVARSDVRHRCHDD